MQTLTLYKKILFGMGCISIDHHASQKAYNLLSKIKCVNWCQTDTRFFVYYIDMSVFQLIDTLQEFGFNSESDEFDIDSLKLNSRNSIKNRRNLSEVQKNTIRNFVKYLRGQRLAKSTVRSYFTFIADFIQFICEKPIVDIDNKDIRLFIEHQVKKRCYSISSHRQLISALKHFGEFYSESKIKVEELQRPYKSKYLPTVLSKQEVIDLLRATRNIKHRVILALLYSSGLRIGELITLRLHDIDIDRRQIFVRNGKGRKDRFVILAESFIPLFHNYYTSYRPKFFVIEGSNGGMYSDGSVRNFLKRSCEAARITKRVTPHTLRHSYATHLIENGVGLRHVQALLGHAKPETTMIYTHVAKKDLLKISSPLDSTFQELSQSDKNHTQLFLSENISG
tara:strand:+ start:730 stop:1914 length:1185 start_codon:yes stop_codon:yes gene_type:complete